MLRIAIGLLAVSACSTNLDFESHCPYTTGQKNEVEFCPYDPNTVGTHQLSLTLGTAQEVALFPTAGSGNGGSYGAASSDSPSVRVVGPSGSNSMQLIATDLGDATLSVTDDAGTEIDTLPIHVGRCDGHLGEYGRAVFCGDADGNHQLAVPANARARITVFTPAYTRLDFTSVASSDWSIVSPALAASDCDANYDYCTNVIEITGIARGQADIGMSDASGELDQLTIDVIDHW
jgi:hypothetical protein